MPSFTKPLPYPTNQAVRRKQLYAAHHRIADDFWRPDGTFLNEEGKPAGRGNAPHGFRAALWHCLSYLSGADTLISLANRIIESQAHTKYCAFAPGAAVEVLFHHSAKLEPGIRSLLQTYAETMVPQSATEDLKIHGYNDNHPFKAMYALIVGGELMDDARLVEIGLQRLREAVRVYARNGFPCEYNSPTYTAVSLPPLAAIVEDARSEEAATLALQIERFFWRDVALHFHAGAGVCGGPMSRAYRNDFEGLLSNMMFLLGFLWPEEFAHDVIAERFRWPVQNDLMFRPDKEAVCFSHANPIWIASTNYHLTEELDHAIFNKPTPITVRGCIESGTMPLSWKPGEAPADAPARHVCGPRRSLITSYHTDQFSLGTAQYSWLDNLQSHGFYATVATKPNEGPCDIRNAAVYFARHFLDEKNPFLERPDSNPHAFDGGDIRTVQEKGTAMVLYQTRPTQKFVQKIRTGIFRPIFFNRPLEVYAGETPVPSLNYASTAGEIIAINEGDTFIGILPILQPLRVDSRRMRTQLHTHEEHLTILYSIHEAWQPVEMTYDALLESRSGFAFEIHEASAFDSFGSFREWLRNAQISDDYYALMRTTEYRREGLELSCSYSPWQSPFRYASINGHPVETPTFAIEGIPDPLEVPNRL